MFKKTLDIAGTFDRAFDPVEGGYTFYPWRWSGAYFVTEEEFQTLKANYLRVTSWKFIFGFIALLLAFSIGAVIIGNQLFPKGIDGGMMGFGIGAVLASLMLWQILAPQRFVWGREPVAPRLKNSELVDKMAKIVNWPMAVMLCVVGVGFIAWAVFLAPFNPWFTGILAIVWGLIFIQYLQVAYRKWAQEKKQENTHSE